MAIYCFRPFHPIAKRKNDAVVRRRDRQWANDAPVLILAMAQVMFDDKEYPVGYHDLGLANENLMLTAVDLGLNVCPMGGFDKIGAIEEFNIPSEFHPVVVFSLGYPGKIEDYISIVQEREIRVRTRKRINEFTFHGSLNQPYQ